MGKKYDSGKSCPYLLICTPEIVKWAWANMEKDGVGPTPNFLSPLNFWTNKMFINF